MDFDDYEMAFVSSFSLSTFLGGCDQFTKNGLSSTKILKPRFTSPSASPKRCHFGMLFSFPFLGKSEKIALPQHDLETAAQRQLEIAESREQYQWTKDRVGDASMIRNLSRQELPTFGWIEATLKGIVRGELNKIAIRRDDASENASSRSSTVLSHVRSMLLKIFQKMATGYIDEKVVKETLQDIEGGLEDEVQGTGQTLEDYKNLFKVLSPETISKDNQFLRDDIFGWYRVAGPNPYSICKLDVPLSTLFPELTNDILRGVVGFENDSLEELQRNDRLFYLDFKELTEYPPGKLRDGNSKANKYFLYAPTALVAIPKKHTARTTVLPLAIRCGQDRTKYPIYTPNKEHTDEVTWLAAKMTVQVADGYKHQCVFHLGRGHLLAELFICATYRAFAQSHPLRKLLELHFEGTAFINVLAHLKSLSPKGFFGTCMAPDLAFTEMVAANSIKTPFLFDQWANPEWDLANRGVLEAQLKFPYRDDVVKLWKAVLEWTRVYVSAYYKSDMEVVNDTELARWCREITDPDCGNLDGFGETPNGEIKTVDYLVRAVAMVIFGSSVRHAAVHFPIAALVDFMPGMPLTGFAPAPSTPRPYRDVDHWVEEMMPDLGVATNHLAFETFGSVHAGNMLGEYGKELKFAPDEVDGGLKEFQRTLSKIAAEIEDRNVKEREVGLPAYDYLLPKNVPNSINV